MSLAALLERLEIDPLSDRKVTPPKFSDAPRPAEEANPFERRLDYPRAMSDFLALYASPAKKSAPSDAGSFDADTIRDTPRILEERLEKRAPSPAKVTYKKLPEWRNDGFRHSRRNPGRLPCGHSRSRPGGCPVTPRQHLVLVHQHVSDVHTKAAGLCRTLATENRSAAADWGEQEFQSGIHKNIANACDKLADMFQESAKTHDAWANDLQPQEKATGASSLQILMEE